MKKGNQLHAFSLIELMLAMGILALITGLVITNIDAIFAGQNEKTLPQLLKIAVRDARYIAAIRKEIVFLSFDEEKKEIIIINSQGNVLSSFDSGKNVNNSSHQVTFHQLLPDRGTFFSSSQKPKSEAVKRIAFDPDRSSTPFMATLVYEDIESTHQFDPFSDLELVNAEK